MTLAISTGTPVPSGRQTLTNTRNRGKIVWVLASSRPDLIEVDLKRPGRVDVKIPLFPTTTPGEGFGLIKALCRKRGLDVCRVARASVGQCALVPADYRSSLELAQLTLGGLQANRAGAG